MATDGHEALLDFTEVNEGTKWLDYPPASVAADDSVEVAVGRRTGKSVVDFDYVQGNLRFEFTASIDAQGKRMRGKVTGGPWPRNITWLVDTKAKPRTVIFRQIVDSA